MPRIVRISDMTDDEKEEWEKQVISRENERQETRQNEVERVNNLFNDNIKKNGEYDTNKHTTTTGELKKAYKGTSNYNTIKKSLDSYYEKNKKNDNTLPIAKNGYISNKNKQEEKEARIKDKMDKVFTKSANMKLSTSEEREGSRNSKDGDMYKITNGKIDDRNYIQTLKDKLAFLGKSVTSGIVSGTTGIPQAGLTDMANEMDKGEEKETSKIVTDLAESLLGMIAPSYGISNMIKKSPERAKEIIETLASEDKSNYEKVVSIGIDATNNAINDIPAKGLFNASNQLVGKINSNASQTVLQVNDKISEPSRILQEHVNEEANKQDKFTQLLGGAAQSVGNMAPSVAVGAINPSAGLATMGLSVKGQTTQEALDRGVELDEAVKIGNTKAMIEIGTEMLTGGINVFGKGALDDIVQRGIDKKVKNEVANFLLKKGVDISGEILEETISDVLNTVIDKGTVDPNASYSIDDWSNTALTTALSTIVLNALTGGYGRNAYKNNQISMQENNAEFIAQEKIKEAQQFIDSQNLQNQAINQNIPQTQQIMQEKNKVPQNAITEQQRQTRLDELKSIDTSNMGLLEKSAIRREIRALENDYNSIEEYQQAEEQKRENAIQEFYQKKQGKQNIIKDNSNYQMEHRPTQNGVGYNIASEESVGSDIYTNPENYIDMSRDYNQESYDAIKSIYNKPNAEIVVYRASPKNELNNGDWITLSKTYAQMEANKENVNVNEFKVKAKDIQFAGDDINEFGYFPQNVANNQETLYNSNESEGGINGQENRMGRGEVARSSNDNRTIENKTQEQYTRKGFKELETRAKAKQTSQLTEKQIQTKKQYESETHKEIRFFDGTIDDMPAFASETEKGVVYFNSATYENYNQRQLAYHESLENEIVHNSEIRDLSKRVIQIIKNDESFNNGSQIDSFFKEYEKTTEDKYAIAKDILCDMYSKYKTGEELDYENLLDINTNLVINDTLEKIDSIIENSNKSSFSMQENQSNIFPTEEKNKTLNPTEISNLTPENASTTPQLKQRDYAKGNRQSNFLSNIITDSKFLNEDLRQMMGQEDNIRYYKGITNEKTLEKAYTELKDGGERETLNWFNRDNKNTKAEDVAKGWILLKQYQDSGDYQSAVEVAKKMRTMATNAGQTVQAYNILSRLTPEGMFYYAQSELNEAYSKMVEGKSKQWIEKNASQFDLTPEETQVIIDTMQEVSAMEDGREKNIKLAEIQKLISDKIPPTAGQSIKSWMRISMLFNPKTQVRNIAGNATILPVNMASDVFSSRIDKLISKKTGVRTTGNTNIKNYTKGFGKGLYESYDDFRRGINTRNVEGNRFEVKEGKNFKDKGIGKALNKVDNILSFALDAGDRGFYEATFTNSINNQLVLNNTTEVTADMIDIATKEALQRTWQDDNAYTQTVLTIRNALNGKIGKHKGMDYGLGDVLIPFAKTPANLTKAIVDYSPVGLTKTLAIDARKFKNSLENGQFTPQMQHKFVQDLGKGMAGSFLYVLGYALAKAGIITGEADDDKDVKNFMKNSLGISSYSIKIGDKSFTYDWAQPVATPFAIMSNYVKYSKDNPNANALEKIWKSMNIGTEQLLKQSFMESLNTVLNGNGTTLENLSQAVLELPSRAIPTFSKQIADMVDGTQRTSFEYDKPIQSAVNSMKAKIPGLSKTLPTAVDTLGNDIQKYGGDNNLWNVMFNPANTNKGQLSKAGKEIYDVYMQTGDTTIFPRTAPYYINSKGEKITMTSYQRSDFQKVTGKYAEKALDGLLNDKDYKKLSNDEKAKIINEIVSDSYSKAKYDILKIDSKEYEKLRNTLKKVQSTSYYNYKFKTDEMKKDSEKIDALVNANYNSIEKQALYENYLLSSNDKKYNVIKASGLNINNYLKYKLADSNNEFKADRKDDSTEDGKTISGSSKNKKYNYIKSMQGATGTQKAILFGLESTPSKSDKQLIVNYIMALPGKKDSEKKEMLKQFSWITWYKDGTFDI